MEAFRLGMEADPPLCSRVPEGSFMRCFPYRSCPSVLRDRLPPRIAIRRDCPVALGPSGHGEEGLSAWKQTKGRRRASPDLRRSTRLLRDGHQTEAAECNRVHSIRAAWATDCRVVNLNLIAHDMRRTAVTNMIEAGIPGDEVMEIVGHRTNAMLRRYMITSEKTAIRVGQRMDAWAREQVQYKTQVQDGLPNKPN